MKVNSTNNRDISFNGFWNSKGLKKALSFAADSGALFAATTTLAFSSTARPLAILAAPKTDKENKKVACAKSWASSLSEFALTLALSVPIVNGIKKINKEPQKFLKAETIKNLKDGAKSLQESKAYELATQMFKLGLGLAVAAPKAILTTLGMPYVLEFVFGEKPPKEEPEKFELDDLVEELVDRVDGHDDPEKGFELYDEKENVNPNFEGKSASDWIAKGIGKILDNKTYQNFSNKNKNSNFPMHIVALKDAITTGMFIHETNKSKKIKEERKLAVMYNAFISTGLSITSSYLIDKVTEKPAQKIIEKIKQANASDPNLQKYLDGFKIAKPIIIVGLVYYLVIPFISTFLAERAEKSAQSHDFIKHI